MHSAWLGPQFRVFGYYISVVHSLSHVWLCNPTDCSMPGFPVHHQLLELAQTRVHWVGDPIQPSHPCCPLLLLSSTFPSIRLFSNESVLHIRWPSIRASASASNKCSRMISFRIDWFDLLAVQGTLKHLSPIPQFKSITFLALLFLYGPTLKSILWV